MNLDKEIWGFLLSGLIRSSCFLFKGLDDIPYMDAHLGGVLFFSDVYIDAILKVANGFSIGAQTAVDTWTQQCGVVANGNMTTNKTITSICFSIQFSQYSLKRKQTFPLDSQSKMNRKKTKTKKRVSAMRT